jgi:hypothetical protein
MAYYRNTDFDAYTSPSPPVQPGQVKASLTQYHSATRDRAPINHGLKSPWAVAVDLVARRK